MSGEKLAYMVAWDEFAGVKFLDAEQAKLAAEDYEEVKRAPAFDDLAEAGRVTAADYLARGWTLLCHECEGECPDDDAEELEEPICCGDVAYCSSECKRLHDERETRIRERQAAAEAWIAKRFPFARLESWWTGGTGLCNCYDRDCENQRARVRFEGVETDANDYCDGCKTIWICQGDSAAWDRAKGGAA